MVTWWCLGSSRLGRGTTFGHLESSEKEKREEKHFWFGLQRIISEIISVLYIRRMTIKSSFEFAFPRIGRPKKR